MKKMWKRTLSLLLVVIMLGCAAPLGALALHASAKTIGEYTQGDHIELGWYPQTQVTDADLIAALNASGGAWHSYGYYSGTGERADGQMTAKDYMQYRDVLRGGVKYRGVKFSQYRPSWTGKTSSAEDNNGYYTGTTYWFRYEPLRWRVLDPAAGLVLCETIVDSQPYNNYILSSGTDAYSYTAYYGDADKTHYANNYAESSLRRWLNREFLGTAFSPAQQAIIANTTLDNRAYSTSYSAYDSASTTDKIFLLSYSDALNPAYGFSNSYYSTDDAARRTNGTDYAKCQGLFETTYNKCSYWWLRSAGGDSGRACHVDFDGWVSDAYFNFNVGNTYIGIRPALKLNLSSAIFQSDVGEVGNGTESLLPVSQTHTVSGYDLKNADYAERYWKSSGVALDGANGTPDFCIPGLHQDDNYIPQGLGYDSDTDTVYITSYSAESGKSSMLFALDGSTGKLAHAYTLSDENGKTITGHVGGVAVYNHVIYIANETNIYTYDAGSLAGETAKATAAYNISSMLNGAKCSYVTITDGILLTGNFYDETNEAYNQVAYQDEYSAYSSVILGFDLRKQPKLQSHDYYYYFTDSNNRIDQIQSAYLVDGILYLVSSYGRKNDSRLYFIDTKSKQIECFFKSNFDSVTSLPMMENGFIKDGCLYTLFESAAWKYNGAENSVSENPTDVIWKIDLTQMKNNAFCFARDSYDYGHSEGFVGIEDYRISDSYYQKLKNRAIADVDLLALLALKMHMNSEWKGSCYGLASVMALSKNSMVRFDDITTKKDVAMFSQLPKPCDDNKLRDIVNYYFLMQKLSTGGSSAIISTTGLGNLGLFLSIAYNIQVKRTLESIVKCANENKLYILSFSGLTEGHTLVLLDCYKSQGKYIVRLYDVNSPMQNPSAILPSQHYTYLYIDEDFSAFTCSDPDIKYGDNIELADVSLMLDLDGKVGNHVKASSETRSAEETHVLFTVVPNHSFKLTNAEGNTLVFDGEQFSGTMTVYDVNHFIKDTDSELTFEIDPSNSFQITCNERIVFSFCDDKSLFALDGENVERVTIKDNIMNLNGKNMTFTAFSSTDEMVAENELGLVSVTATADQDVSITKNGEIVDVKTDGTLKETEISSYIGVEQETYTIEDGQDQIAVSAHRESCTIIVDLETNADSSVTGADTYNIGDTVTLTAISKGGEVFDGWYVDGKQISTENPYTFTATENVTIRAVFKRPASFSLSVSDLTVQYKSSGMLAPVVTAYEGARYTLAYSGFDSNIISVDKNGNVTTVKGKVGTTTVTVTATDENGNTAKAKCAVTVKYAWWQWLIRIFLLGFLWY